MNAITRIERIQKNIVHPAGVEKSNSPARAFGAEPISVTDAAPTRPTLGMNYTTLSGTALTGKSFPV